jgi:hypothetical protein
MNPIASPPPQASAPSATPSPDPRRLGVYRLFLVGSWLHVVVGAGHLILAHFPFVFRQAEGAERLVQEAMKALRPMPGTQHTLFDFYVGNSFSVGLMHVAFGLQSVLLARAARKAGYDTPRGVILVAVLASWASVLNALLHFPPPPIALLAIASMCLTTSLFASLRLSAK